MKKILALALALLMVLSMTACSDTLSGGGSNGPNEQSYIVIYDSDNGADVLNALPANQFLPVDARELLTGELRLELTLLIEYGEDYTMIAHLFNPNQTDESAADYFDFRWGTLGVCKKEDGVVTLELPTNGDNSFKAGSDYAGKEAYNGFSMNGDGSFGSWYSDDTPACLEMFTEGTTLTVEGSAITGWNIP